MLVMGLLSEGSPLLLLRQQTTGLMLFEGLHTSKPQAALAQEGPWSLLYLHCGLSDD